MRLGETGLSIRPDPLSKRGARVRAAHLSGDDFAALIALQLATEMGTRPAGAGLGRVSAIVRA